MPQKTQNPKRKKKNTHTDKNPQKQTKLPGKLYVYLFKYIGIFFSSDYFIQVSETCCRESNIQYSYKVFDKSETDKKS